MANKPNAWRGLAVISPDGSKLRCVQEYPCSRKHYDCLVIPDGATVPLPASARLELERLRKALIKVANVSDTQGDFSRAEECQKIARDTLCERATKAKGRG